MFRKLLVAVDGSDISLAAAAAAGQLAASSGGEITLCAAVPPAPVFVDAAALTLVDYDRRAEEEAVRILAEARRALPPGVPAEERVLHGQPAAAIVDEARRGYDLVVVGSHGRTGIRRFLLGSVANQVVTHAPVPVLVHRKVDSQSV